MKKEATVLNAVQVEAEKRKRANGFETIKIPGSNSEIYKNLLKHKTASSEEITFMKDLENAVSKSLNEFRVFSTDPSMDDNGKLQFVPGFEPAVGYSYKEWEEIAKENGLRLGTVYEYTLFLGWLINSLIQEGWSEKDAWYAVCSDSSKLGHYYDDVFCRDLEPTGSRRVCGKSDLANTVKILARDEISNDFLCATDVIVGFPIAGICVNVDDQDADRFSVGWLVL